METRYLLVILILVFHIRGLGGIDAGVEGCQINCGAFDRLQGPTRMTNTKPHPWNVASYPTKNHGFCNLGCQYFFSEHPEISKCKAECMAAYRYRVVTGYSDAAEEAIENCQDGCDIAFQVCQEGFFCKSGDTQAVSVTALTLERTLMCYQDIGNSDGATCNIILPSGEAMGFNGEVVRGLSKGEPLVVNNVNSGSTFFHDVAYLPAKNR